MFTREDLRNSWLIQEFAEEAKAEGKQEGLEKGEQIGEQKGVRQVAANLLKIGISAEQVSIATGLTISEIQQL